MKIHLSGCIYSSFRNLFLQESLSCSFIIFFSMRFSMLSMCHSIYLLSYFRLYKADKLLWLTMKLVLIASWAYFVSWFNIVDLMILKKLFNTLKTWHSFNRSVLLAYILLVSKKKKGHNLGFQMYHQKQPFRGVLSKRCSENMQQIYRRTPMPKCDFNIVALQLYWNHTSAWVLSCKFAAYLHNTFY